MKYQVVFHHNSALLMAKSQQTLKSFEKEYIQYQYV